MKTAVFVLSFFLLGASPLRSAELQDDSSFQQVEVIKNEREAAPDGETEDEETKTADQESPSKKPVSWQKQLRKARDEADLTTPESRKEWRKRKSELRVEHRNEMQAYRESRQEIAAAREKAANDEITRRKDPSYTERHKKEIAEKMKNFRVYTASRSQAANPPPKEAK